MAEMCVADRLSESVMREPFTRPAAQGPVMIKANEGPWFGDDKIAGFVFAQIQLHRTAVRWSAYRRLPVTLNAVFGEETEAEDQSEVLRQVAKLYQHRQRHAAAEQAAIAVAARDADRAAQLGSQRVDAARQPCLQPRTAARKPVPTRSGSRWI